MSALFEMRAKMMQLYVSRRLPKTFEKWQIESMK